MDTLNAQVKKLAPLNIPDAPFGDMKLNVFPIRHLAPQLPEQYSLWQPAVSRMLSLVPYSKGHDQHYVTIDSRFFTTRDTQRREGVHIDGNFCADPDFCNNGQRAAWGGTTSTWGGTKVTPELVITMPWVSPYGITPPLGQYVSSDKGGILTACSYAACEVYEGKFNGEMLSEGDCAAMDLSAAKPRLLPQGQVYFMSSDTPHESIPVPKGTRRTFLRITLDHAYPNKLLLN